MTERIVAAHESECVTERCERDIHTQTDRQEDGELEVLLTECDYVCACACACACACDRERAGEWALQCDGQCKHV